MTDIVPATFAHLDYLREHMRLGERLEIACLGVTPELALTASYGGSLYARTGIVDGRIAAVWGVGGCALGGIGEPWLVTTPVVEQVPIRFIKVARAEVGQMLGLFPVLSNYVTVQYRQACRFLEVVGFRLSDPFAVNGTFWHEFRMER